MSDATCPTCGRSDFKNRTGMKQHHAIAHGESLSMKTVECDRCGSEFEKRADHAERLDHHFCDEACEGEWRSDCLGGENSPQWSRVESECHWCGDAIQVERRKYDAYKRNFCSKGCLTDWQSEWRSGREKVETRPCSYCGDPVERFPSEFYDERQFCTHGCLGSWLSEQNVGEANPSWSGGHERYYGSSWQRQRSEALDRDGHQCVVCGMTSSEHIETHDQGLHVHHITPFRKYGVENHERANRLENLVTLCQTHHVEWEGLNLRPQTPGAMGVSASD